MARDFIAGATRNKGGLHRSLGIPEGQKIPKADLQSKPGDSTKVKREKALARTLESMPKRGRGK